jgi:uncharacterized protein (DUF58 family)
MGTFRGLTRSANLLFSAFISSKPLPVPNYKASMFTPLKSALVRIDGQAWLRFFIAIVGLALGFASAVFSTVARESGNFAGSVVFASAALLLAGSVGLTTVPYLARRVASHRMREAFNYQVTREGLAYLGVALIIAIAALNTANNLLFIILAAMLAAIVVSGFASAAVLRDLRLDINMPDSAFAGRPLTARVRLLNPRRWIPAFSISVAPPQEKRRGPRKVWELRKTEFVIPLIFSKDAKRLHLPDYTLRSRTITPPPGIFATPVYFTYIQARSSAEAPVPLLFERRGLYTQEAFSLATRFPFSFLIKSRRVVLQRALVVYPALLEPEDLAVLPMITGEFVSWTRGRGSELYLIRDYAMDDPARFVDWKATARTGTLKVREFTREDERRLRLIFDNPAPGAVPGPAYEHAISMAASLACHFHGENIELSFVAPGYSGAPHLHDFLYYLALVKPTAQESVLESLPFSPDYNVIITARPQGTLPTSLWASSYVIYM